MRAKKALIAFNTVIFRESKRTIRLWRQVFLPSIVTSALYFVIFGQVIGNKIGLMANFSYIQFIAPGLIMMQMITSAFTSSVNTFYIAKFQRHIQELLVSPMSATLIILGFVINAILRGLVVGIMVTIVALFFTHIHIHSWLIIAAVSLCATCLFALAGLINGVYAKSFDDVSIIPTFIIAPLTYLGGVFYSIGLLPNFWQKISLIDPITYIINAFRFGFLGFSDSNLWIAFLIMFFFIFILSLFAFYLIKSGLGLRE